MGGGDVRFTEDCLFILSSYSGERFTEDGSESSPGLVSSLYLLGSKSYPLGVLEDIEKSSSPPGGPGTGFLPSFMAFLMSAAFHTAYFCFCSRSGGSSPNWLRISKKRLAA